MSIIMINIVILHSLDTKLDMQKIQLLILSLRLATTKGAYQDNLVNFRAYSLRLMFP